MRQVLPTCPACWLACRPALPHPPPPPTRPCSLSPGAGVVGTVRKGIANLDYYYNSPDIFAYGAQCCGRLARSACGNPTPAPVTAFMQQPAPALFATSCLLGTEPREAHCMCASVLSDAATALQHATRAAHPCLAPPSRHAVRDDGHRHLAPDCHVLGAARVHHTLHRCARVPCSSRLACLVPCGLIPPRSPPHACNGGCMLAGLVAADWHAVLPLRSGRHHRHDHGQRWPRCRDLEQQQGHLPVHWGKGRVWLA